LQVEVIDLFTWPKKYVDEKSVLEKVQKRDKVCVSFEVDPDERDYLLRLVMKDKK
jgi:hypothetical protein